MRELVGADPHDHRRADRGARARAGAPTRQGVSAPDLIAPVIAFRSWRLAGAQLVSPFIPCRWEGRVMHATCSEENRTLPHGVGWLDAPHASPDPECQCGIYASHTPGPRSWFGEAYWCEGVVSAWGRIVGPRRRVPRPARSGGGAERARGVPGRPGGHGGRGARRAGGA